MPDAPVDWTASGWGIRVGSAQELFRLISHIALLEQSRIYAWRGQSNARWQFSSSLYRVLERRDGNVTETSMRAAEVVRLTEARRWGLGRDLGTSATDMHMLAVLQHHGVPTRLFDVTANPMTALYFAVQDEERGPKGRAAKSDGVVFAVDVTESEWYETFQHAGGRTYADAENPLSAQWGKALEASGKRSEFFRAFPALPDDRMKAQEGFFLGSMVPDGNAMPGVQGIHIRQRAAIGSQRLRNLLDLENRGRGRPAKIPFVAIVIPADVKAKVRNPLKRTYNRRPRVMFPDVDGFRDAWIRQQLD